MPFLVDTNLWLELLLNQQRAQEVRWLLEQFDRTERGRMTPATLQSGP